jgi:type II secretory pathway pseudopilin PulG
VARNALLGFALLAALAGCSPAGDEAEAQAAEAQLAALRAHNDSLRQARPAAAPDTVAPDTGSSSTLAATAAVADSVRGDSATVADAEVTDSIRKAREIEVMRETFAYSGGSRDPFASLLNTSSAGPELGSLELVGVYQNLRDTDNSVVVLRDKATAKRYKVRVGDQLGRAKLIQIRPRDAVFTIRDFGFERQETLSLRKQEVETP